MIKDKSFTVYEFVIEGIYSISCVGFYWFDSRLLKPTKILSIL